MNFFDTADCYKNGQGEELLGNALKGNRQKVIIGTKGRWQTDPNPNSLGASRYHIINAVEDSLKRLKTDYIDIYHLHGFDPRTSLEDTLRTLDNLIRAGKVRYIGVSNYAAWQLAKRWAFLNASDWKNSAYIRDITILQRESLSMKSSH
ncbi:aldo/keto reductase [Raoultella sp. Lac1]|uniref:aldo/keto reductase n=1 Tax=Raoultella sp. Lac1 TaxID=2594422 RepID=UPI003A4DA3AF